MTLEFYKNPQNKNIVTRISRIEDIKEIPSYYFDYFYGTGFYLISKNKKKYGDVIYNISIFPFVEKITSTNKIEKGYNISFSYESHKKIGQIASKVIKINKEIINTISEIKPLGSVYVDKKLKESSKRMNIVKIDDKITAEKIMNILKKFEENNFFVSPKINSISFDIPQIE